MDVSQSTNDTVAADAVANLLSAVFTAFSAMPSGPTLQKVFIDAFERLNAATLPPGPFKDAMDASVALHREVLIEAANFRMH